MRIIEVYNSKDLERLLKKIKVDSYGIKIMLPKTVRRLILIRGVSNIYANILKQELLSLGGDVAVSRGALTGQDKTTDCLIMGNLSQLIGLREKLKKQPFGLDRLAKDISNALNNYQKESFTLKLGDYRLNLNNKKVLIMGIVNLTPDSFSGDGLYQIPNVKSRLSEIIDFVEKKVQDGADIIDVGGQSSRPGARPVSLQEELERIIPVLKKMVKKIKVPISIDTYRPEVAEQALDNGVSLVNDITGLRNPKMRKLLKRYKKAAIVIMHMQGMPSTMQINPHYESLIDEIIEFLSRVIKKAEDSGIERERIIVDPGIGFGKTLEHNLLILKALKEFKILGRPILVGPSRKSFIGKILNLEPSQRLYGSIASVCLCAINGASIVRVHDVKETRQALSILENVFKINYT
ncbi:MAG: dihydropteroate synthase [Candidatus Omnitrophica bacterium]|nr:dihydropteroate synthase [Candidatus Omnitrophota bacterium]